MWAWDAWALKCIRRSRADVTMATVGHAMLDGIMTDKREAVWRSVRLELGIRGHEVARLRAHVVRGDA